MVAAATDASASTPCSGFGGSGDVVESRSPWWGSDERHTDPQEVVEISEATAGEAVDIDWRDHQEFSFGNLTVSEAAEQFASELRSAVGSGT